MESIVVRDRLLLVGSVATCGSGGPRGASTSPLRAGRSNRHQQRVLGQGEVFGGDIAEAAMIDRHAKVLAGPLGNCRAACHLSMATTWAAADAPLADSFVWFGRCVRRCSLGRRQPTHITVITSTRR
jgi:hypothetical protein